MSLSLTYLFLAAVGYLLILFLIAYATERGWIPGTLVRHPMVYVLSLGVYATSWSFYGSVGFARTHGFDYLTIYIGPTLAFILAPVLLIPILRLVREHQLTSLADLFAFRFRSQAAGILVTLFALAGTLPYIALQIRAVTESIQVLSNEATPTVLALGFCVTVVLFAILFGARHVSPREKHEGLVAAIAFESLVKLLAFVGVGLFALYGVFGGVGELGQWLERNPAELHALQEPVRESQWATLIFLAFGAAFLLPRQFHMAFTENIEPRALPVAMWAFPLFLLLFNLWIPPILWAGTALGLDVNPDYFVLGITVGQDRDVLPLLAFLGGVSAASAMMIVTTLALAAMCVNHLMLPVSYPDPTVNLYRWLIWGRRIIIALIVMAGFGFYVLLESNQGLVQLGLVSFVAVAQFLPGVVGVLYWGRATRLGFILGLAGGAAVWMVLLVVPLLEESGQITTGFRVESLAAMTGQDKWSFVTFWTLAVNALLFVAGSLVSRQSPEETEAAEACVRGTLAPPVGAVRETSPGEFRASLAEVLGEDMAEREVHQALADLDMAPDEHRATRLLRLRDVIQRNLSGLMGPELARMVVNRQLRLDTEVRTALADSIRFVEERLEVSRSRLRGLAAQMDALRRYHRQVLEGLPVGVCSVGPDRDVVIWNPALARLSGVDIPAAVGTPVQELPDPWSSVLGRFIDSSRKHLQKVHVTINEQSRWFNLHKAALDASAHHYVRSTLSPRLGIVILVEDLTETRRLEAELSHAERLASIGRLAAGVAHEIGNPVTGIASLAQNILAETSDPHVRGDLEQVLEQTARITSIVRSLVSFSHGGGRDELEPTRFRLDGCIDEAIRLVRLSHAGRRVRCESRCPEDIVLHADRQRTLQVLVNLLSNACEASEAGGSVVVEARRRGGSVEIEVVDDGSGIPAELVDHVFDPFFTTKDPGEGTGLGLALVYSIVKDHGGSLAVDSAVGRGTRVRVTLPAGPREPAGDQLGEMARQ